MRKARRTNRQAFTIMEIVLVVGVIIIIGAIAFPLVETMIIDARISAAGDMVRARVADCRANALEQGRPWRIGFLPDSGVIQLAPDDAPEWSSQEKDAVKKEDLMRAELPKDIVFTTGEGATSGPPGSSSDNSHWTTLAVYLGDGSARDDTVAYFGHPGISPMRVRVRGLTGSVSVEMVVAGKEQP